MQHSASICVGEVCGDLLVVVSFHDTFCEDLNFFPTVSSQEILIGAPLVRREHNHIMVVIYLS